MAASKKAAKRQRGRPSKYTEALATEILDRLTAGEPLAQICRDPHMPGPSSVYRWLEANKQFSADFARARESGFDQIAMDALLIADTPEMGEEVKYAPGKDGEFVPVERKTADRILHRKLQVETRLKLLAKWDPKRYGARQTIEHDVSDSLAEKLRAARERAGRR